MKTIKFCLLIFCLSCLVACTQVNVTNPLKSDRAIAKNQNKLSESPPPKIIRQLNRQLEKYEPQVKIIAPANNLVSDRTEIAVEIEVTNLPLFKDDRLKLGNHLDLILDNEPARQIYDLEEPIVLKDLTPGTHSLRVFADRPWGESYKNEGAFAQTTFSIISETNDNITDDSLPLLTYNNPTGTYSSEPILLDFYLTNAPLHSVAKNDPKLTDWRIKATVNGDSFLLENWQPVYLKGFNKGENWIQLELIDEAGNNIANTYNNTVRVINYDPQQTDTLGKLMSDRLSAAEAKPIVEQTYYIQPVGEPEIIDVEEAEDTSIDIESDNATAPVEESNEIEPETISQPETTSTNIPAQLEAESEQKPITTDIPDVIKQPSPVKTDVVESETNSISEIEENTAIAPQTETETIAISKKNSDSESTTPIAEIEILQPESVEITEDEIVITIPNSEENTESEVTQEKYTWWKKILVTVRQKLESLIKLLPSEA